MKFWIFQIVQKKKFFIIALSKNFIYLHLLLINKIIMKKLHLLFIVALAIFGSSCTAYHHSMKEPNARVEFKKEDFSFSNQVSAEAKTTTIIGIDFSRLFTQKTGTIDGGVMNISIASLPVVGNFIADKSANYALYELMTANPGYDVIFYPQYETKVVKPILGIGFLTKITTVKVTAKLAKLK